MPPPNLPLMDLKALWRAHESEFRQAIDRVLESAQFIKGPEVDAFEKEFAAYCGVQHACGVANGTDAIVLALKAWGIGPGDEVITVPFTFIASVEAIVLAGATPVLVDVDPKTAVIDPRAVAAAITAKTKAILPVHLYGRPCPMAPLLESARPRGIRILEDACQAHGARYRGKRVGALADAAVFSFFPSKNLGAFGDAGMIVSDDEEFVGRARLHANHGRTSHNEHTVIGSNSRLDALQAAILRAKLRHLDDWTAARRTWAAAYREALRGVPGVEIMADDDRDTEQVYHLFIVHVDPARRTAIQKSLAAAGIDAALYYPTPVHLQPAFAETPAYSGRWKRGAFPASERLAASNLAIPMHPLLTREIVERVASALRDAVRS